MMLLSCRKYGRILSAVAKVDGKFLALGGAGFLELK
jgi:hypothetical protein